MRKLRVVFTTIGAVPALAVAILPMMEGCGSEVTTTALDASPQKDAKVDVGSDVDPFPSDAVADVPTVIDSGPQPICGPTTTFLVDIPPPGVAADPGQICAVVQPPVTSNTSARVTLTGYSSAKETAKGYIAVPSALLATIVGLPTVTVTSATISGFAAMQVANVAKIPGGFTFDASWPNQLPHPTGGGQMTVKAAFTVSCSDGGTQTVESITKVDFCVDGAVFEWVSSGDTCTVCTVIAEMAPSPIPSDNQGDDLALGRVIRIRVIEVARAGRQVLLFAENDAGDRAAYEWRVSGGKLDRVADDVMLWTMPEDGGADPFGQVAVWNDEGAVVENFLFGAA